MKRLFVIFLSAIILVSCSESFDERKGLYASNEPVFIDISKDNYSLPASANNFSFTVGCQNAPWTITDIPSWLHFSKTSGDSSEYIEVQVDENKVGDKQRSASVHLSSKVDTWKYEKNITFTQEAKDPYINLSRSSFYVNAEPSSVELTVKPNCPWEIINIPSWLHFSQTSSDSEATIYIQIDENTKAEETRNAEVTIVSFFPTWKYEKIISFTQKGPDPFINISQSKLDFGFEASTIEVPVESNCGWTVSATASWINVTIKSDNIVIQLEENILKTDRESSISIAYNGIKSISKTITVTQNGNPSGYNKTKSSNCFIITESGNYLFSTVQGNSNKSVGNVSSAVVLWESYGNSTIPSVGDLVSNVTYSNGNITFTASDKKGNAVIAAKDAGGNILWSWHIWMTDQPEDQVYCNNAGTMMDRNLGAISATPGDVGSLGLLYQWGRKDPFLNNETKSTNSTSWTNTYSSPSYGTIAYATAHPTIFITAHSANNDWYCYYNGYSYNDNDTDHTRWSGKKTIYDPCPAGYQVPGGGDSGLWAKAFGTSQSIKENYYDSVNNGYNFGNDGKQFYLTKDTNCWYPLVRYLDGEEGSYSSLLFRITYWSHYSITYSSIGSSGAYGFSLGDNGLVFPSSLHRIRANGSSVRCCRE